MGRPPKLQNVRATGETLFRFAWWIDQDGYDLETEPAMPALATSAPPWASMPPPLLDMAASKPRDLIRGRGGPPRYYRPMEAQPGLWREFAETVTSPDGALAFVTRFGLLWEEDHNSRRGESVEDICSAAKFVANIVSLLEAGRRDAAIEEINQYPALCEVCIFENELRPFPKTLMSALLIQTGEALTRNLTFHQCANPSCSTWFKVGTGASTKRRLYCSDACRVAGNRHAKLSMGTET
jgi:hypothetical protein